MDEGDAWSKIEKKIVIEPQKIQKKTVRGGKIREVVPWGETKTLEEHILTCFERNEVNHPEFQALLAIYGREKIMKLWLKHKNKVDTHREPGDDD